MHVPTATTLTRRSRLSWWAVGLCLADFGLLTWLLPSLTPIWLKTVVVLLRCLLIVGVSIALSLGREARQQREWLSQTPATPIQEPPT
jgi:hypothetical protein